MVPDFGLLPPEINSGLMYAGPGAGSMLAAAAAWAGLSAELGWAASSYATVIAALTSGPWLGPSAVAMAAAASPFVTWLAATAMDAEQVSTQAMVAAAAYEAAFAMTVPPPVIAANRAQLMALISTNFFGQNTPAIMATEAHYSEMWAQDAAAMTAYDASTLAVGAQLTSFAEPPDGLGPAPQAAASVTTETQSAMSDAQLLSSLFQSFGLSPSPTSGLSPLEMLSMGGEFAMQPMSMLVSQVLGQFMGGANPLMSGAVAGMPSMGSALASAGSALGAQAPSQLGAPAVLADAGRAGSIGALSVPPSWATEVQAPTSTAPVAGVPTTGVSQVTPSVPRVPFKPAVTTPGRGVAGVNPAIEAPRSGVLARPVVG
ncbi:PPE family protein [Mycobacterium seoulense]|uniref:PPE family protein n=1 Tax=Mycobacterium seoulense TaxID=386911 RepID=A0A7I7NVQ4_9MYCO|nr:PPE family protein [Mycobacterium seoulense]MCV7440320.1 PPE family protein [Mycobacterium seoulense]BBY00264.1 PPE family protein [Mycobacterium seoulense]